MNAVRALLRPVRSPGADFISSAIFGRREGPGGEAHLFSRAGLDVSFDGEYKKAVSCRRIAGVSLYIRIEQFSLSLSLSLTSLPLPRPAPSLIPRAL